MSIENLGRIEIHIDPYTLDINTISTNATQCITLLKPGQNMISLLKQFKPCYTDFPAFNALLTELKLIQKNKEVEPQCLDPQCLRYQFRNNQIFLETFICSLELNYEVCATMFTIDLDIKNDIIRVTIFGTRTDNIIEPKKNKIDYDQIRKYPALLKHELTNTLNIINMSSILINTELEANKNPDTLIQYNKIIRDELKSAVNLLNVIDSLQCNTLQRNQVSTLDFYNFIDKYLISIDSIYPIYKDGSIKLCNPTPSYLKNAYISIELSWLKIILDNIFKNIYGYLGHTSNKRFTGFLLDINIPDSCIVININNSIQQETSDNMTKCQLFTQLLNANSSYPDNKLMRTNLLACLPNNQSQGINIIDTLCTKQNIRWGLYECLPGEYTFELHIPINNKCKPLGLVQPLAKNQTITCRQDNKSKSYLNASSQHRETTI